MILKNILHATQYYRSPTPLKNEWAGDLQKIKELGLNAVQIRINWRNNERVEGEYRFDDVDELIKLAHANGLKVIIKFLLECAPQYVFDKYGGSRIGPKGEIIAGGSHGAFYAGGWLPCFTNPNVKAAARRFVEKVAERYADCEDLILWNAWNEPRNRPVEECFCPHCRKAFGEHMRKKFGTIEALNDYFGVAEESFDNIALPAMPHGFWDIFEFKKWKSGQSIYDNLHFVYEGIRKFDKNRPIMSHVGFCAAFQNNIGDLSNDDVVSKAVDFYGTSLPFDTNMDVRDNRLDMLMLTDYLRSVDENYFVYEIYPGLGFFKYYDTPFDMSFKLYAALGGGAKGLCYWQYRSERVGMEYDCAGLADPDGTPREVATAVKSFSEELSDNLPLFNASSQAPADIAIVFDYDCSLLSLIEDSCGDLYDFKQFEPINYYRRSNTGMYRLLRESNVRTNFIRADKLGSDCFKYKALYFPYYCMIDEKALPALQKYVSEGGVIIADEGFGLRTKNTWLQAYDVDFKPILNAKLKKRRADCAFKGSVLYKNETLSGLPFASFYQTENAETLATFSDGSPALTKTAFGKGCVYLFGFALGYAYETKNKSAALKIANDILAPLNLAKYDFADAQNDVFEQDLVSEGKKICVILNASERPVTISASGVTSFGKEITANGGELTLPAFTSSFIVKE